MPKIAENFINNPLLIVSMKVVILFLFLCAFILGCATTKEDINKTYEKGGESMKLSSNAFQNGSMIPSKYACKGDNINPQLSWSDAPAGTKSFALIVDDPDAPAGTWVHWLVKDILADTREIKEDSIPGTEVENDFGKEGYGGPCPPSGVHRYFFKLYALNVASFDAYSKSDFYNKVDQLKISESVLMGKYSKG